MTNESRLVGLAPVRRGCQVGRVRLDQQAIERQFGRNLLELDRVLERDDARKGNVKTEFDGFPCGFTVLGETVENTADASGALLFEDAQRVGFRCPGMDDQRLAALARGGDMDAETLPLPFQIARAGGSSRDRSRRWRRPWDPSARRTRVSTSASAPSSSVSG